MSWLWCLLDRTGLAEPRAVQFWGLGAVAPACPVPPGAVGRGNGVPRGIWGSPLGFLLLWWGAGWGGSPGAGGMLGGFGRLAAPCEPAGDVLWSFLRGFRFCISWCRTLGSHPSGLCVGHGASARAEQWPQASSSPAPFLLFSFSL